ncbi:MFS transporter [Heyndrickxia coagulans]|uniref:MFS transporter n=1 Tax=Heyndrickxia coagulans TaxID=1398 RepID=A0AAW7CHZ9_HEYCO|nr:MFS transporter [Heyndrickxia coagulans]MDL5039666.1 MFS transporter [Heyndrickxia coagulans]
MKFFSDRRLITIILANVISSIGTGITGTAIPWLLLNYSGGEVIYGYTYLFTTIAAFILSPFIGSFIDKYSRKDCLLLSQGLGLLFILPFTIHLQFTSQLSPWELVIIQIGGFFYWSIQVGVSPRYV